MRFSTFLLIIIIILLGIVGIILYQQNTQPAPSSPSNGPSTPPLQAVTMISVFSPQPGDQVSSPLVVQGKARGNWFFEASFPAKLYDGNGNLLVQAPAQALSDWMTTDFVPFLATLSFSTPGTATGTLVLEKDNPSALPENAGSMSIPVSF